MRYAWILGMLLGLGAVGCASHHGENASACCDKKSGGDMKCCTKGSDCCMSMAHGATTKPAMGADDHAGHH